MRNVHLLILNLLCLLASTLHAIDYNISLLDNIIDETGFVLSPTSPLVLEDQDTLTVNGANIEYSVGTAYPYMIECLGNNAITISNGFKISNTQSSSASVDSTNIFKFTGSGDSTITVEKGASLNALRPTMLLHNIVSGTYNENLSIVNKGEITASAILNEAPSSNNILSIQGDGLITDALFNSTSVSSGNAKLYIGGNIIENTEELSQSIATESGFFAEVSISVTSNLSLGESNLILTTEYRPFAEVRIFSGSSLSLTQRTIDATAITELFNVDPAATLIINNDNFSGTSGYNLKVNNFNNAGTVSVIGSDRDLVVTAKMTNRGVVTIAESAASSSQLRGEGNTATLENSGTINIEPNSQLQNFLSMKNSGTLNISGTMLNIPTLTNSGALALKNTGSISDMAQITNSGTLAIAGSASLESLENTGTLSIDSTGVLELTSNSLVNKTGNISISGGTFSSTANVDLENEQLVTLSNAANIGDNITIDNNGIVIDEGANYSVNSKIVNALNGTYEITGSSSVTSDVINFNNFKIESSNSETVTINSSSFVNASTSTLNFKGDVSVAGSATINNSGTVNVATTGSCIEINNVDPDAILNISSPSDVAAISGTGYVNLTSDFSTVTGVNLNAATLSILGELVLASGSSFVINNSVYKINIDSPDILSGLTIDQNADFNGTELQININRLISGSYSFPIFTTSGTISDAPEAFNDIDNFFTSTSVTVGTSQIDVNYTRNTLEEIAKDPNAKLIAPALDQMLEENKQKNDIAFFINSLEQNITSAEQLDEVLLQLAPVISTPFQNISVQNTILSDISNRMHLLKLAYNSGDFKYGGNNWIRYFNNSTKQRRTSEIIGYRYKTHGYTIGFDYIDIDGRQIGIAGSFANSDLIEYANFSTNAKTATYLVSVYGQLVQKNSTYYDWSVSLGYNKTHQARLIELGYYSQLAQANYSWQHVALKTTYGWDFQVGQYSIVPYLGAGYNFVAEYEYTEKGPSSLNLIVDSTPGHLLHGTVGLRFGAEYDLFAHKLRPELLLAITHNFLQKNYITSSQFILDSPEFSTNAKVRNDNYQLGASLEYTVHTDFTLEFSYYSNSCSGYQSKSIYATLKYMF